MSVIPAGRKARRWLAVGVVAVVAGIAAVVLFRAVGPWSPSGIKARAVAALQRRDSRSLCELADPEELARLNLTPSKVDSILRDVLGENVRIETGRSELSGQTPVDQQVWKVYVTRPVRTPSPILALAIDSPRTGWKLNLSFLLRSLCYWSRGPGEGPALYRELCHRYQVDGLREQDGGYASLAVLEERTALIESLRR
jgi:hypothetical protein